MFALTNTFIQFLYSFGSDSMCHKILKVGNCPPIATNFQPLISYYKLKLYKNWYVIDYFIGLLMVISIKKHNSLLWVDCMVWRKCMFSPWAKLYIITYSSQHISIIIVNRTKRYFLIEKQIARYCVAIPLPPLCNSNNWPCFNSIISANHEKCEEFYPIVKYLYHLLFL